MCVLKDNYVFTVFESIQNESHHPDFRMYCDTFNLLEYEITTLVLQSDD